MCGRLGPRPGARGSWAICRCAADVLSDAQLAYAANDVRYLLPLLHAQMAEADASAVRPLIEASFEYLPTRGALDIRGAGDVFVY